jgi:hypothetical protein
MFCCKKAPKLTNIVNYRVKHLLTILFVRPTDEDLLLDFLVRRKVYVTNLDVDGVILTKV